MATNGGEPSNENEIPINNGSATMQTVDQHHPLYLQPSDTPGSSLFSVKLTGPENYTLWCSTIRINLLGKSKLGFVDGRHPKQSFPSSLHELWEKCNAIVLSWIINSVSAELLCGMVYASSAHKVWVDLQERFDKVNGSQILFLHKEIATLTQGISLVSAYFSKLKEFWTEFDALMPCPGCNCVESRKYVEHFEYQRGEVPSWFGILHQLQVLNLGNNSFTGSIPSSFSNISTLETLNLNFNSIDGQIPKVIGSLINLRVLKLGGNKLIGFIPTSLLNAPRLERLELSSNSLQGNIPERIGNLHNLNWLAIQYNQLTGSITFTIFNISRIEVFSFIGNCLSGSLPNGLCNGLPILKALYLSDNKLHGHLPTSLSNCSQLQVFSLSENEFDGPIHSEIGRLSNLQQLCLGTNHFTGMFYLMNACI
ncbi:hypothetical protein CQW23_30174 [Capsicum baccatum]|uniref:Retrotransposon Copia-like N-terminal domain-containing protein n=1 Tax=Capsicum baccatum TaxID=33114 RepID=A0A2G2VB79_CAPBA|nr:hypothetical protein CQW23_30174 [Capsicum baccatum]